MPDDVVENTDVSLVSGKLRCTGTRLIDSDTRDHRDAIIKRNEQMIIANNSASMYYVTCCIIAADALMPGFIRHTHTHTHTRAHTHAHTNTYTPRHTQLSCNQYSFWSYAIVYKGAKCLVFSTPPIAMRANILACHTERMWRPWR